MAAVAREEHTEQEIEKDRKRRGSYSEAVANLTVDGPMWAVDKVTGVDHTRLTKGLERFVNFLIDLPYFALQLSVSWAILFIIFRALYCCFPKFVRFLIIPIPSA